MLNCSQLFAYTYYRLDRLVRVVTIYFIRHMEITFHITEKAQLIIYL